MIDELWKRANITTLLVLPLYNEIMDGTKSLSKPHLDIPFLLIAYYYGLENAYLFEDDNVDYETVKIKFNNQVLTNKNLTNSSYHCFNDRLINSKYFKDLKMLEDGIIYYLTIPEQFQPDIKLITQGKYSKTSEEYKQRLLVKQKYISPWKDDSIILAKYIIRQNLSYSIVAKAKHLKKEITERIGVEFDNSQEFYLSFDKQKETLYDNSKQRNYQT